MRKTWVLVGAAVAIAVTATGAVVVLSRAKQATPTAQEPLANTAKVEQGKLSAMVSLDGTLTYRARSDGSPYSVIAQTSGTATWLPDVGQVVEQGEGIFGVDGNPVVLLYGSTPAYRTLSTGMTGADVTQLNADLVDLGYATAAEIPAGANTFTSATATALMKLQATRGLSQTGTLTLGQAVFEPVAVRVTGVSATLGGPLRAGQPVLQGTSTTRVVTIGLAADQQSLVKVGDQVVITLPDNSTTPGKVTSVGMVATTSSPSNGGSGNRTTTPTVPVEVQPTDPAATGGLDQAPVQVSITTKVVEGALSVPVTALVGKSGGGFAVEVVRADGRRELVAVKLGLFDTAGGRVQVEGNLHEGDQVVVPSL
ncbi:MAG TPA: efflux RND transporter periplasmic adaptor subunit [Dehalococcoidia bacterium]|nr:efflux RND transporter periplasmic adaptor subunit [Dehalococcoidia bacterium]